MYTLENIYYVGIGFCLLLGICGMFKYEMKITFIWQPILFSIFWPMTVVVLLFKEIDDYFQQEKKNGY